MKEQQLYQRILLKQLMEKITVEEMDALTDAIKRIILNAGDRPLKKTDTQYIESVLLSMADVKD